MMLSGFRLIPQFANRKAALEDYDQDVPGGFQPANIASNLIQLSTGTRACPATSCPVACKTMAHSAAAWVNAPVGAGDHTHQTPLHDAAREGRLDMVELLPAHKAQVNDQDRPGKTLLQDAASYGHKDVVECLRQHGGHE